MARRLLILVLDRDRETLDVALAAVHFSPAVELVLARDQADARTKLGGRVPDLALVDVLTARGSGPGPLSLEALLPAGEPLLLLAHVENLERIPEEMLRLAADVLVKPLRTAEARFRIARLLASGGGEEVRDDAKASRDETFGLLRLRGAGEGSPRPSDPLFAGASAWTALLGDSEHVRELRRQLEIVAPQDAGVLLVGEPGTRREIVARALHTRSGRGGRPFLTLGPERLLGVSAAGEDDTAGDSVVGGAGTDAEAPASDAMQVRRAAESVVREAAGGTLFVPELTELDLDCQARLLAVLEELARLASAAGSSSAAHERPARLIASTRTPLARLVQEGAFREDLFYHLHAYPVRVPSLRERGRDVLVLAAHIASRTAASLGRPAPPITPAAQAELLAHDWPGNLRELEHCITRAVHASHDPIDREHLELATIPGPLLPFRDAKRDVVDRFERTYAVRALALANGNISAAARLAGKDRKDFWSILRKHGIAITKRGRSSSELGEDSPDASGCNPAVQDGLDARAGEDSCGDFPSPRVSATDLSANGFVPDHVAKPLPGKR